MTKAEIIDIAVKAFTKSIKDIVVNAYDSGYTNALHELRKSLVDIINETDRQQASFTCAAETRKNIGDTEGNNG